MSLDLVKLAQISLLQGPLQAERDRYRVLGDMGWDHYPLRAALVMWDHAPAADRTKGPL